MTYQISEETRRKAELSRREAESLVERELKCPECGYKAGTVFSDCTGPVSYTHLDVYKRQMQDILDNIGPTAEVRKIIRPIYNFKAGDEE